MKNPKLVHDFYNGLRQTMNKAKPNAAHKALTELQKNAKNINIQIITQNVDLLHEKAGNQNVYHMHGRIDENVCLKCGFVSKIKDNSSFDAACEHCGTKGFLKPNIVFFGEIPLFMNEIEQMLTKTDIFVAVGTSGIVYPAAGFVQRAKIYGAKTYLLNLDKTENNLYFDEQIYGKASVTLPQFCARLVEQFEG